MDKPPSCCLRAKKAVAAWIQCGHLSPAAEPNCVVVLEWYVGLHWIFMVAAGGKSSVLILHEALWICREKSVLLSVLFPALDTC